ncbi:hypothetical protein K501DRAFT_217234 [Backusella circina FSU 941]|nr:hypothetical protein K501DRAFT_217234 [Backusella circina FSU 941]
MHELAKSEKKEGKVRARSLQARTGPITLSASPSTQEQQQKRIAERAAKAMAQVLRRRREPRSLMMWGDRKKAVIKRYPDGSQEIIVPQTLTAEQEQYEFPPRSRFLKKLATSAAEKRRLSTLQITPVAPDRTSPSNNHSTMQVNNISSSNYSGSVVKQPDQLALQEWFSKSRTLSTKRITSSKDRAVIDWINDVEKSSKSLLSQKVIQHRNNNISGSSIKTKQNSTQSKISNGTKPSATVSAASNKIQFKSDAGKRWASSITANASLAPPDDTCRKHYVPRRLLLSKSNAYTNNIQSRHFPPAATTTSFATHHRLTNDKNDRDNNDNNNNNNDHNHDETLNNGIKASEAASKIQSIWKEYEMRNASKTTAEVKVGESVMDSTGERTPIAGMVQLVQMLHLSLKQQQQRSTDRMEKLEALLLDERRRREQIEKEQQLVLKKFEDMCQQVQQSEKKDGVYQALLDRVSDLEQSVKREGHSRKLLEDQLAAINSKKKKSTVTPKATPKTAPKTTISSRRKVPASSLRK